MSDLKKDISSQPFGWRFTGRDGEFLLPDAERNSGLYFPLANAAGFMSCVTPTLGGDSKTGQNSFYLQPVSIEDLHNNRSSRNFWCGLPGREPWSAAGNSASQLCLRFTPEAEEVSVTGGFLYHIVTRVSKTLGLSAEIVSFAPVNGDRAELMRVTIQNTGGTPVSFTPTAAIPIYGRSADNLRDHRHVTSLLNRARVTDFGVESTPALSFDERGHKVNTLSYCLYGAGSRSGGAAGAPVGFFPAAEDFLGEGGTYDRPAAVVENLPCTASAGDTLEGYEVMGGLRFADVTLAPGQRAVYVLCMIVKEQSDTADYAQKYCSGPAFEKFLDENKRYWKAQTQALTVQTGDPDYSAWFRWVTLQPVLRRIYGCSFLPHHDYGRGGRGWRDLWQDCLALLLMDPGGVTELLFNNFAGVRPDGRNATIIGTRPGEFVADRNNIRRVWMDHGAWPCMTTLLYVDQTGDLPFLLREQSYFEGNGRTGTIFEHLLLQNLIQYFNVGDNGNILTENADWNDGLDMAPERGESVAFTAFYAGNLERLAQLARLMKRENLAETLSLFEEAVPLLSSDGDSPAAKRLVRDAYFRRCREGFSGRKTETDADAVAAALQEKSERLKDSLRRNEWLENEDGFRWFNGYYDNDGVRFEGGNENAGVKMTLTGQVFQIMCNVATDEQTRDIVRSVERYLHDPKIGYRLNTDAGGLQLKMGRAFGYAFGHKENGAMFTHMTVMYANALYQRGFVREGYRVLKSVYGSVTDYPVCRIYPGLPEYVNQRGRGMYSYLTGSASWYLLTAVTEVFGVKGRLGALSLEPKLAAEQFGADGRAVITASFAGKRFTVTYENKGRKEYGEYRALSALVNGAPAETDGRRCLLRGDQLSGLPPENEILIILG